MYIDINNIIKQYHLEEDIEYRIEFIEASSLLCPERLDIAAKYLYLNLKEKCPEYAKKIYLEHIRIMTKGSFVEPYSNKKSAGDFLLAFDALYEQMKLEGYDDKISPIPVDKNYRIMDGAHRVAICIKLGIKVPIIVLPIEANYDIYNQDFFEKYGIDESYLDEIVKTYIRISKQCVCINIWPSAKGHNEELDAIINKEFATIYKKDFLLNENGAFYYLAQIYKEYSWAQNNGDGFSGVYRKLLPCFPTFDPVRAIFVELNDQTNLLDVKEKMRDLYGLGKHSLHITDNQEETVQMANIVLSNNTISFLNKCNPLRFKNTLKLLEKASKIVEKRIVCFSGSIVLSLYGIRSANDLDYICEEDNDEDSHNKLIPLYGKTKGQLLYQPDLHFSFFDLSFITLNCIKNFKERRGEKKDYDDILLMKLVSQKGNNSRKAQILRLKRRIIASVQGEIIRIAHKTGTYEQLRSLYKRIKQS